MSEVHSSTTGAIPKDDSNTDSYDTYDDTELAELYVRLDLQVQDQRITDLTTSQQMREVSAELTQREVGEDVLEDARDRLSA